MNHTDAIIIGGGQAGLAISRCLTERGVDHAVLERGRAAERWRSERWDSLRLLTPRWQSRLPGWSYRGPDPHGFMTRNEVINYLDDYARSFNAPLHTEVTVTAVEREGCGFRVETDSIGWKTPNVVIATGHCAAPRVPDMASALPPEIVQIVPSRYRNPDQLPPGGVLVVGASATGIQLACEIARSHRNTLLAAGRHIRLPRSYRGLDVMAWLELMGVFDESARRVRDLEASRHQPSLQLIGNYDHRTFDLNLLRQQGVQVLGRAVGVDACRIYFADDLSTTTERADRKMYEQLDRVDEFIAKSKLDDLFPPDQRPARTSLPAPPRSIDLKAEGIGAVLWATGYRREYPWLRVPVLKADGEIRHDGGVTAQPGLYALGLQFMRRRNSSFIDGVGADAEYIADHLLRKMNRRRKAAA
ncbi:MAG: NAD(P)-binding domain-containing protein [Acidobacteria bacterium]|nr:NAD(P)-binding domain-containing protein [Acidobacteriota bacterium]MCW5969373.1 NAD(P)-binding domain-containing protein [Blastocatellales bacterium]